MDNQRLLIWALFGMMLWLTWQAWQQDYGPQPAPAPAGEITDVPAVEDEAMPALPEDDADSLPVIQADAVGTPDAVAEQDAAPEPAAQVVTIRTDVLDVDISTRGGTLVRARLPKYPVHKDQPDIPVTLLSPDPADIGRIRTGLRALDAGQQAPGHDAVFAAAATAYALADGADELVVPLTWTDGAGLTVEKRFRFRRGEYAIGVEQVVRNDADTPWKGDEYAQIQRRFFERDRSMFDVDSYSFDGPIVYDGEHSEKLKYGDLLDDGAFQVTATNGWVAAIQHHFLSAVVPERDAQHVFQVRVANHVMTASVVGAPRTVAPGESTTFERTLFVGPKLQQQLQAIDTTLKLTVDYGWLHPLSAILFWLLAKAYGIFANWGVAIILVTILIKLVFYKLTESSGRSMAKMRALQPRLKSIQERYKDDRPKQSQAMMDLYKREKVNPAAGCLPILIQMPFFLAFYWALIESVEMRQAPFALWITDLSSRDPYFILPLIMGAAMLLQQRLNPQVGDPVQVKVMQIMPIIFTAMFAFFPAGLVLYWVTNTVLSIAQQWKINKVVEQESKAAKGGRKPKSD